MHDFLFHDYEPNPPNRASERFQRALSHFLEVVDLQRAGLLAKRRGVQLRGQRIVSANLHTKAPGGGRENGEPGRMVLSCKLYISS